MPASEGHRPLRQAAGVRREAFVHPPTRRNRLWQADFSEYETAGGGRWNLGGVVDYWAKVNLAAEVTITKTTSDAIAVLEAALADVDALLGVSWVTDITDPTTGEIATLRLVTDNGSCFTSARCGAWVAAKRHIAHIRTRRRALVCLGLFAVGLVDFRARRPMGGHRVEKVSG